VISSARSSIHAFSKATDRGNPRIMLHAHREIVTLEKLHR